MSTTPVTSYNFDAMDESKCRIKDTEEGRKYIEDVKNLSAIDLLFYYNNKLEVEHQLAMEKLEEGT